MPIEFNITYPIYRKILKRLWEKEHIQFDKSPSRAIHDKTEFVVTGYKPLNYKEDDFSMYIRIEMQFKFPRGLWITAESVKELEPRRAGNKGMYLSDSKADQYEETLYNLIYPIAKMNEWENNFHRLLVRLNETESQKLNKESKKRKKLFQYKEGRKYTFNSIIAELIRFHADDLITEVKNWTAE